MVAASLFDVGGWLRRRRIRASTRPGHRPRWWRPRPGLLGQIRDRAHAARADLDAVVDLATQIRGLLPAPAPGITVDAAVARAVAMTDHTIEQVRQAARRVDWDRLARLWQ